MKTSSPLPELLPCVCGRKKMKFTLSEGQIYIECPACYRASEKAGTAQAAADNWNIKNSKRRQA